jgi:hypothetical protein
MVSCFRAIVVGLLVSRVNGPGELFDKVEGNVSTNQYFIKFLKRALPEARSPWAIVTIKPAQIPPQSPVPS